MFTNETLLDEPRSSELKRTIMNSMEELKVLKEDTKKQLSELKEK